MRATFAILICCLYALSAVEGTPSSKSESAEVQQGNAKAASPLKFWSDDKSGDDGKDAKDDKDNKDDNDECASRSVSVLIGTSSYAIPCLQGDSIVNLNGLITTPTSSIASSSATEVSSSAVSSSAVDSSSSAASSSAPPSSSAASSSDASSATDSTTTTTDTTTSADSSPTFTVTFYESPDCTFYVLTTSLGSGCFDHVFPAGSPRVDFSVGTTSTTAVTVNFYFEADCAGIPYVGTQITSDICGQHNSTDYPTLSYSVTTV